MWYVIIFILVFAIPLIVLLGREILFNPRLNSAISILWFLYLILVGEMTNIIKILLVISIIDCIRDIRIAKCRYDDIKYYIDSTYMKKSLISIFTIGLSRAVFFIIDCPYTIFRVFRYINRRMRFGYPLESYSYYYIGSAWMYYYRKFIQALFKKGKIISNTDTIESEFSISKNKYIENNHQPKKETKKYLKSIGISLRKESNIYADFAANHEISKYNPAYMSTKFYQKYSQRIAEVMLNKGTVSPETIKEFDELKDLNLTMLLDGSNSWSVPFIIMSLDKLVADGIIEYGA